MSFDLSWPDTAIPGTQSPPSIEAFLKNEIVRRKLSLVGELDLSEPTSYGGIGWSLLNLANYLVSKPIIRSTLTDHSTWSNGIWPYPATLAIWSVGRAQKTEDGSTKLWNLDGYTSTQKIRLAEKFFEAISVLGLETFDGELENAQKYVQLARIHAMIPDFALDRYSEIINRGVKFNRPKFQILSEITADTIISKAVKRLFAGNPTIGLDLIERSFNFVAYGHTIDLPERIRTSLSRTGISKKLMKRVSNFPQIRFVEWERRLEIRGATSWKIEDEAGNVLGENSIPATRIYTSSGDTTRIELIDPREGYLIFDIEGKSTDNRFLPNGGGFILWSNRVKFLSDFPNIDPGHISGPGWEDWQYSYFQDLLRLEIQIGDLPPRVLLERKSVVLHTEKVPHLVNGERLSVFNAYPFVEGGQFLKVTNNLNGDQWKIDGQEGPLLDGPGGVIDLTVSAGLGKSRSFTGLVVPGIQVDGLETALTEGEVRNVTIRLKNEWSVVFPEEFAGKHLVELSIAGEISDQIPMVKVRDPQGKEHFIGIEIPILSWSIELKNQENEMVASEMKYTLEHRKQIQAIILHEVDSYIPVLKVGSISVSGRKRGRDVRYDLRFLQEENLNEETIVSVSWNYKTLDLVSFRKESVRTRLVIKDLRDLPRAAVEAGTISLESWNEYLASKLEESKVLKERTRAFRGR